MWYFVLFGAFAIWVLIDSRSRRENPVVWTLGTLLLGPLVLPFYVPKRPLRSGEVREGGTGWDRVGQVGTS